VTEVRNKFSEVHSIHIYRELNSIHIYRELNEKADMLFKEALSLQEGILHEEEQTRRVPYQKDSSIILKISRIEESLFMLKLRLSGYGHLAISAVDVCLLF
jgi:hypothetical protein